MAVARKVGLKMCLGPLEDLFDRVDMQDM